MKPYIILLIVFFSSVYGLMCELTPKVNQKEYEKRNIEILTKRFDKLNKDVEKETVFITYLTNKEIADYVNKISENVKDKSGEMDPQLQKLLKEGSVRFENALKDKKVTYESKEEKRQDTLNPFFVRDVMNQGKTQENLKGYLEDYVSISRDILLESPITIFFIFCGIALGLSMLLILNLLVNVLICSIFNFGTIIKNATISFTLCVCIIAILIGIKL